MTSSNTGAVARNGAIALILFVAIVLYNGLFIVTQTEQAVVLSFGKPVTVHQTPGLKFKIPFIQNAVFFDKRIIDFNAEPKEVIAADKKTLFVDAFMRYRIVDPLKFYQSVNDERLMNNRLNSILESSLREAIASEPLTALLSPKRASIMTSIQERINTRLMEDSVKDAEKNDAKATEGDKTPKSAKVLSHNVGFGIEIVDVRIMRTELPEANSNSIYEKMRMEREREAKQNRALGEEEALRIRSRADKDRTVLLAEAQKKSETIRGQGDGEATRILAQAYGKDREFFEFYRSMQAYQKVLNKEDTTLILSPDTEFLREMDRR